MTGEEVRSVTWAGNTVPWALNSSSSWCDRLLISYPVRTPMPSLICMAEKGLRKACAFFIWDFFLWIAIIFQFFPSLCAFRHLHSWLSSSQVGYLPEQEGRLCCQACLLFFQTSTACALSPPCIHFYLGLARTRFYMSVHNHLTEDEHASLQIWERLGGATLVRCHIWTCCCMLESHTPVVFPVRPGRLWASLVPEVKGITFLLCRLSLSCPEHTL